MLKENKNLKEALERYIYLMEKREYFDAHEVLEEAWHYLRKSKDPLSNLAKGLINGAIAFEHIKRDRKNSLKNAHKVIKSFDRYIYLYNSNIREAELFKIAIEIVKIKREKFKI
jgi:hypothetical protein